MENERPESLARAVWETIKDTFAGFFEYDAFEMAAALGYYTLLSMAPLLLLLIGAAGLLYGEHTAREQLINYVSSIMGHKQALAVQSMLVQTTNRRAGIISAMIGTGILIFGATTVFAELQTALNKIWGVEAAPTTGRIWAFIRRRLLSLGIVFAMAFILLVSMVISTAIDGLHYYFTALFPGEVVLVRIVYAVISFAVIAGVIAAVFKFVPDVTIGWWEVGVGAAITSALFSAGRYLIGVYLTHSRFTSAYGAAGSIILVVAWVYYSSLILFFGAETTQVIARRFGKRILPASHARFVRKVIQPVGERTGAADD